MYFSVRVYLRNCFRCVTGVCVTRKRTLFSSDSESSLAISGGKHRLVITQLIQIICIIPMNIHTFNQNMISFYEITICNRRLIFVRNYKSAKALACMFGLVQRFTA